jgi:hypothetical protein
MKDSVRKARQAEQQANRAVTAAADQLMALRQQIAGASHAEKETVVSSFTNLKKENAQLQVTFLLSRKGTPSCVVSS